MVAGAVVERHNIPAEMTTLVGRRTESAEVRQLLTQARLVTLTGVGGVGKTRLALAVARGVRRVFEDGVWFAGLADLAEPNLLALTVLKAARPQVQTDAWQAELVAYLGHKHALIVLDNCEHLIEECAALASTVLRMCPQVKILATSREQLRVAGEALYPVPPLSLPDPMAVGRQAGVESEAVQLFVERASAADHGFTLTDENCARVAELCRRLDGLPLAVELAAMRTRALSVSELLARHDDRYRILTGGSRSAAPRHQTLRAAVDWSYDLCSPSERALWAQLSVFAGAFDIAAAESVCPGGELEREEVLPSLASLVDRSIVIHDEAGYRMLDTIRKYGLERLDDRGARRALSIAHREYYASVAEEIRDRWFGPEQDDLLGRLHRHHANLRAALDFCLAEPDEKHTGLRMAAGLWPYWMGTAAQREGAHWLGRLLAADPEPSPERAEALWTSAYLAIVVGAVSDGLERLDECQALAEQIGHDAVFAHAVYTRGLADLIRGEEDAGIAALEEGVALERALPGINPQLTVAMIDLGLAHCSAESVDRALVLLTECQATCVRHGENWTRSWALVFMGLANWVRGDLSQAVEYARAGLAAKRSFGDLLGAAVAVEVLAWTALSAGDARRAAELLGASQALWEPLGEHMSGFIRLEKWSAECTRQASETLGAREFDAALARGRRFSPELAIEYALGESIRSAAQPRRPRDFAGLTPRELEVARMIADGKTNREIADALVLSRRTVEAHVEHILTKLGFSSRTKVVAWLSSVGG